MPLEWFLALRFLREGRTQTILIIAGASVGVLLVVFLSALIDGLQRDLLAKTLGTQPHVVLRVPDEVARPLRGTVDSDGLRREADGALVAARVERPTQRLRTITDWTRVVDEVAHTPGVGAISPVATGPALASRGGVSNAVALFGVLPDRFSRVYDVAARMVRGRFDPTGDQIVIGRELADDLGVTVGDKVRLSGATRRDDVFTVAGVFDLGVRDVNKRWVLASLRAAQTLLDMPGGVTLVELRVADPFLAPDIAARLGERTGLDAQSWTTQNAQLLSALQSQSGSSQVIQIFVLLGVAVAIASVLVISVVQKERQIGILRAMGAPRSLVLRTFLIQGGLVGLCGFVFGASLGAGLTVLFASASSVQFPIALTAPLFLRAAAVALGTGLVAAVLPARRASRLLPAVAIRHE